MASAVVSELDRIRCSMCLRLPMPPIYHCRDNHIICHQCRANISALCSVNDCMQELHECELAIFLLSNMEFVCPNKQNGCTTTLSILDIEEHVENCAHSECSCPICVTDFKNATTLKGHFGSHKPIHVTSQTETKAQLVSGERFLLKEEGTGDLFVLKFEEGNLILEHMWWDDPRKIALSVEDSDNCWCFTGSSSKMIRPTRPTTQCIQVPPSIFEKNNQVTCVFTLGEKADTKRLNPKIRKLDDAEIAHCLICSKWAIPPVYHCSHSHVICSNCRVRAPGNCEYCYQEMMVCQMGTEVLRNCDLCCTNEAIGCSLALPIQDFEGHSDDCRNCDVACPLCALGCRDVTILKSHIKTHKTKQVDYMKDTKLTIVPGRYLLQEDCTGDTYLLIFEGGCLSVQHMCWDSGEDYYIQVENLDSEWYFLGKSTAVETIPKVDIKSLQLPRLLLQNNDLPITITIQIMH